MNISHFVFNPTPDPDIEDDEYIHTKNRFIRIQACPFGFYYIPTIENNGVFRFGKESKSFKEAVENLTKMIEVKT